MVPIFLAAAAVPSMPAQAIDHARRAALDPRPTLARKRGRVGRGMAPWQIIGMAGTSPAVTKWELPRVFPL
jgi:hypothetical protein